jgi:hypothetical protein
MSLKEAIGLRRNDHKHRRFQLEETDRTRRTKPLDAAPAAEKKTSVTADAASSTANIRRPTDATRRDARDRQRNDASMSFLSWKTQNNFDAGGFDLGKEPATRTVDRNPDDVNHTPAEAAEKAKKELEANKAEEQRRLEALDADTRSDYQKVADTVNGDPTARRALQEMLIDGRLDGDKGKKTLDELEKMSTGEVASGIDRNALVADTVQELEDPSSIAQHGWGTCAATIASTEVARTDPAEYARLVRGLASPEGKVTMKNGEELKREVIAEPDDDHGPARSQSQRLLAPALMEYGNGSDDYDPRDDSNQKDYGLFHKFNGRGLDHGQFDRVIEGLTGKKWNSHGVDHEDGAEALDKIQQHTDGGRDIPVGLDWGDGGHKVLVTRVTDDRVYYVNPWGQEESMSRAEMEARIHNVSYPEG